jgi:hypothetical protein
MSPSGKIVNIKKPSHANYHPTYKIFNHLELIEYIKNKDLLSGAGMIITELGDKFMLINGNGSRINYSTLHLYIS